LNVLEFFASLTFLRVGSRRDSDFLLDISVVCCLSLPPAGPPAIQSKTFSVAPPALWHAGQWTFLFFSFLSYSPRMLDALLFTPLRPRTQAVLLKRPRLPYERSFFPYLPHKAQAVVPDSVFSRFLSPATAFLGHLAKNFSYDCL